MSDKYRFKILIGFFIAITFVICAPMVLDTWWKYQQKELQLKEKELEIRKLELLQKQDTIQYGKTETGLGQD